MSRVLVAALAIVIVPAVSDFGQSGPYHAVVVDPEVKLRAGPSDRYPETTLLKKGDTVLVHDEENGWLAVQDPPQIVRSISWVRTQVVNFDKTKPIPQLVVVDEAGATLRAGEMGVSQPSSIQKAKVPAGTILTVIGPGVSFAEGTWYPVVPPAGDYRYVPKQAVKYEKAATATFTVRDTTPPAVSPAGGTAPVGVDSRRDLPTGGKNVNHPLWAQAEAAERDGRHDRGRAAVLRARPRHERAGRRPRHRQPLLHPHPLPPREEARHLGGFDEQHAPRRRRGPAPADRPRTLPSSRRGRPHAQERARESSCAPTSVSTGGRPTAWRTSAATR